MEQQENAADSTSEIFRRVLEFVREPTQQERTQELQSLVDSFVKASQDHLQRQLYLGDHKTFLLDALDLAARLELMSTHIDQFTDYYIEKPKVSDLAPQEDVSCVPNQRVSILDDSTEAADPKIFSSLTLNL